MPKRAFISLILKVSGNVNADIGVGTRIPMKKIITWDQGVKAFVSPRCIRRCIRERLHEKGLAIDPLSMVGVGAAQQLGDFGDPVRYVDDDLFGFLVPEMPPRKRYGPIKISPLISLRHTEVKVEFAARFPREFLPKYEFGFPVPFEVEVAEWLGRLDAIVSDRVGCFDGGELTEEVRKALTESHGRYYLDANERRRRLRAFLEVLLHEGWHFPRASESPCIPEFYYAVTALTERFTPIFGYIDVNREGLLDPNGWERMRNMYGEAISALFLIDYKSGRCTRYRHSERKLQECEKVELTNREIENVIRDIVDFIVPVG